MFVYLLLRSLKIISNIENIMKLPTGGPCWHYIAHLSARAHKYTRLRHEESKENLTAGLVRIF